METTIKTGNRRGPKPKKNRGDIITQVQISIKQKHRNEFKNKALQLAKEFNAT
jgi:hypothetical protein